MLEIKNISYGYEVDKLILDNISFKINQGDNVAIIGPSGCGKSTLLRIIAGLIQPNSGEIIKNDVDITSYTPQKRNIGMLFQDYVLFPHMSVKQNITYASKENYEYLINLIGLKDKEDFYPHQLSGGQKQRVALARTLAQNPDVILLDEPFSNYDENLKHEVRKEIASILKEHDITLILVTHDIKDAEVVANKIINI